MPEFAAPSAPASPSLALALASLCFLAEMFSKGRAATVFWDLRGLGAEMFSTSVGPLPRADRFSTIAAVCPRLQPEDWLLLHRRGASITYAGLPFYPANPSL